MTPLHTDNPFLKFKARSLILWFFIISFISGLLMGLIGIDLNNPIMTYIIYFWVFSALCLWTIKRFQKLNIKPKYLLGKFPSSYNWLPLLGLVLVVLSFSAGVGIIGFYFLSLLAPSFYNLLFDSITETNNYSFTYNCVEAFAFIIFAPITEEFIFRGVLLHRWAAKWGIRSAIIVSSVVFGLLHINPIGLSVFGIIMSLLYIKSRTLIVPIVAHALNNAFALVLKFLATSETQSNLSTSTFSTYSWQVGLFLITLSVPFLIYFIYKKWPSQNLTLPYFANARHNINSCPDLQAIDH